MEPSSHSYLGSNQQDIFMQRPWRHSLDESFLQKEWQILLIPLQEVVLFPGETIPLRLGNSEIARAVRDIITNDHQFLPNTNSNVAALDCNSKSPLIGIVSFVSSSQRIHKVGTAIEVRSCSAWTGGEGEDREGDRDRDREGPGSGLAVTAKGRQRFKILRVGRQQAGLTYATVRFLSDASPEYLARKAAQIFTTAVLKAAAGEIPEGWLSWADSDAMGFSFFLCANLPFHTARLQELLEATDVVHRLRLMLSFLREVGTMLACGGCGAEIARQEEIFTFRGAEGMVGAYVNAYGWEYPPDSYRAVSSRSLEHCSPSLEDSWFPGYAWTIARCDRCFTHLGWRYTLAAVDDGEEEEEEEEEDGVRSTSAGSGMELDSGEDSVEESSEGDFEEGKGEPDLIRMDQQETAEISQTSPTEHDQMSATRLKTFWGLRRSALKSI
eukprot:gene25938-34536_t